jgi:hypothetical protein
LMLACAFKPSFAQSSHPDSARISFAEIDRFWNAYAQLARAATRADSAAALQSGYFTGAGPALQTFIDRRLKSPDNMLRALGMLPRYYAGVRASTLSLKDDESRIRADLRKVEAFYPAARYPNINFIIAGFISQGTVLGDDMLIAAEMVAADAATPMNELPPFLRDVDLSRTGLSCILVHELFHYQQDYPRDGSLLAQSLIEGIADFLTEKTIGCVPTAKATYDWGDAHERQLWQEFQSAMSGTDFSKWLYNGSNSEERPSQLGYWMGYRIAATYYEQAANKTQAVHDMLHIQDFRKFLDESGYAGKFR